eukprot:GHVL01033650.1.p1 GENE.GHVL01033650.1~~GHVL01033650.1.p1  ORF type:complete len:212 (+),score=34.86 GHVL01033650.1:664-1299(+)
MVFRGLECREDVCMTPGGVGDECSIDRNCRFDLFCIRSRCSTDIVPTGFGDLGERCFIHGEVAGLSTSSRPCREGLLCRNGICRIPGTAGDICPSVGVSLVEASLYCVQPYVCVLGVCSLPPPSISPTVAVVTGTNVNGTPLQTVPTNSGLSTVSVNTNLQADTLGNPPPPPPPSDVYDYSTNSVSVNERGSFGKGKGSFVGRQGGFRFGQ